MAAASRPVARKTAPPGSDRPLNPNGPPCGGLQAQRNMTSPQLTGRRALLRASLAALVSTAALLSGCANLGGHSAAIPRSADGHPDFSGIWQTTSAADFDLEPHSGRKDAPPGPGIVVEGQIPYLPKALAQRQKNFEARHTEDPRLKCYTLGVPRGIYYPEPFQIFQRPRDLTLLFQFGHSVRTIHTNGTQHPDNPNDWWLGDSRGHWEGDTLVVDARHFNDETWLDRAGNFHSDALHVTERWQFIDANTVRYQATLEDLQVYSRPWDIEVILHRHREKDFQLIENYCFTHEYDAYYPPKPKATP